MSKSTLRSRVLPAWLSPLILLAAGAYLRSRWGDIPERWVVHWGIGGVPNGWANRTPTGVYLPLIGGALLWALLEGISALMRARSDKDPALAPLGVAGTQLVRLVSLWMSVLFSWLAITLPLGPHVGRESSSRSRS